jgi:hypothetical protein
MTPKISELITSSRINPLGCLVKRQLLVFGLEDDSQHHPIDNPSFDKEFVGANQR